MQIPVAKPYLIDDDARYAAETILSGWVTQGPRVQEFEAQFAAYVGARAAVAVSSCTTALHLALLVAGVGPGDEVICPSLSFIATANAIMYTGATPVFAEVRAETYNLDINDVAHRLTPRTKAVILVHQIGLPGDLAAFQEFCAAHGLKLIEDAACAAGSMYRGQKIGAHSDLVCFSFHPRKVITTGDGGMITTSNVQYAERLRWLRQHGMSVNDRARHEARTVMIEDYVEIGYNYRLTDIQAAIGVRQLAKLDWLVQQRRAIAQRYLDAWRDLDDLRLPSEPDGCVTNYQSFSVYLQPTCRVSRDELMQRLLDHGIATRRGIMNAHQTTAYRRLFPALALPISEDASDRSILLPLYVPMSHAEIDYVIQAVRNVLRGVS